MTRLPEKSYETPSPCVRDRAANASSHVAAPSPEARPNGTSTVKVDPFPTSLDNDIRPPIISVNRFVMARPRPVPPRLHEDSSPCSKDENIRSRFSGLMPQPVSVTEKRSQIASSCAASSSGGAGKLLYAQRDAAVARSELESVANEIVNDLVQPKPVADEQPRAAAPTSSVL